VLQWPVVDRSHDPFSSRRVFWITVSLIRTNSSGSMQSVMNSAARLVFSSSKFDHITPFLHLAESTRTDSVQARLSGFQMLQWTWSINSFGLRNSGLDLDPDYDQRRRHHCLTVIHGWQPSAIKLFHSSLLVYLERTAMPCRANVTSTGDRLWNSLAPDIVASDTLTVPSWTQNILI